VCVRTCITRQARARRLTPTDSVHQQHQQQPHSPRASCESHHVCCGWLAAAAAAGVDRNPELIAAPAAFSSQLRRHHRRRCRRLAGCSCRCCCCCVWSAPGLQQQAAVASMPETIKKSWQVESCPAFTKGQQQKWVGVGFLAFWGRRPQGQSKLRPARGRAGSFSPAAAAAFVGVSGQGLVFAGLAREASPARKCKVT
jgi:hypothetical protein